jgi:hypothetical protein
MTMVYPIRSNPKLGPILNGYIRYRFLFIMTTLFFTGILMIVKAVPDTRSGDLMTEFGIGLFIAGTVGLGVEFFARKEMQSELRLLVEDTVCEPVMELVGQGDERTQDKIDKMQEFQGSVSTRIDEIRFLLWNNNLRELGVREVHTDRDKADFRRWLASARPGSTIRLMALCLNPATTNWNERLIRGKLLEGCTIRLLLLDPYSPFLDQRAHEEEPKTEEPFKERVRKWAESHQQFARSLEASQTKGFELGFYRAAPSFIADNETSMLVGFYLNECRGDDCPHLELEIKPGGVYKPFRQHFESFWVQRLSLPERRHQAQQVEKDRRGLYAIEHSGQESQTG